ncbi:MAG: hypothetical protein JKX85_05250 [Phycisphaeraceae bacterium]|nr:hypothetical protein [Phycisphaeraceae bacterium]
MQDFNSWYSSEIDLLKELYGSDEVARCLPRIREIFEFTEAKWGEYVRSLGKTPVRYLLIAEAPPWSEKDKEIQYVLDPASRIRSFMGAIRGAFVDDRGATAVECLAVLAKEGFLVVDSLPFAMEYTKKRSSKKYDQLISATVSKYLQPKIKNSGLEWSPEVKVAFAVKRNARSIMKSASKIELGGKEVALSEEMIAVNGAGYPCAKRLKENFQLRA